MPRPPILETIDWQAVFDSGQSYAEWLKSAENGEHAAAMEDQRKAQRLDPQVEGLLKALPRRVNIVAIAEDWCGDVVRHAPVAAKLADAAPNVHLSFISREQHPKVFVRFLTNGGEAIPKFVFLSADWVETGSWGPMPDACRELISRGKACGDVGAAREKVSALYNADPEKRHVVNELVYLIDRAASVSP